MSTVKVIVNYIVCDSCGARFEPTLTAVEAVPSLAVRVQAGMAGWKFGQLPRRPDPNEHRDWDWCPNCDDPRPGVS